MEFEKTSEAEEAVAAKIVDAAYAVHKALGPGLLERVYETCFCHELGKRQLSFQRQADIPIEYDGIRHKANYLVSLVTLCLCGEELW